MHSLHQLINNTRIKDFGKTLCLSTSYEFCIGYYIRNGCILVDPSSQLTEPPEVSHPRCTTWYKTDIHSFITPEFRIVAKIYVFGPNMRYFGHYIGDDCILVDSFSQLTELPAVSHQRPTSWFKVNINSLIMQASRIAAKKIVSGPNMSSVLAIT
jgi:hypothetical protein